HVDRHLRVGGVGIQQDAQPVGVFVFGDSSDGGLLLDPGRQGLADGRYRQRENGKQFETHRLKDRASAGFRRLLSAIATVRSSERIAQKRGWQAEAPAPRLPANDLL